MKYKNKEWLENEYLNKKRGCGELSKECLVDPKTIYSWLKKFSIPTRQRGGTSSSGSFKKGHKICVGRKLSEKTKNKIRENCIENGRVPYLKNGEHWLKQIGVHSPNWKGGITPERQQVYSSIEWCEAVKYVWKRDNAICQKCGKHHNQTSNRGTFHIHHIESFAIKEKRTDVNNLILLCKDCHKWVHSKQNKQKQFLK